MGKMKKITILLIAISIVSIGLLSGCVQQEASGNKLYDANYDDEAFHAWFIQTKSDADSRCEDLDNDLKNRRYDEIQYDLVTLKHHSNEYLVQLDALNVSSKWQAVKDEFRLGLEASIEAVDIIQGYLDENDIAAHINSASNYVQVGRDYFITSEAKLNIMIIQLQ